MAFDLSTAKPVSGGFDLSTAKPVAPTYNDIPGTSEYDSLPGGGANVGKSNGDNILGKAVGVIEAPLSIASSAILTPVAAAYGLTGGNDVREQNKRIDQVMNYAYKPVTNTGNNLVNRIGGVLEDSGIQGVAPMSELSVIGATAPPVSQVPMANNAVNGLANIASKAGQAVTDARSAAANKLMASALKATPTQWKHGDAAIAVDTLLKEGVNPTRGGVNKLREIADDLNAQVAERIRNSNAVINKNDVMKSLDDVRKDFTDQVSPTADLNSIDSIAADFQNHPAYSGDTIPVQDAQRLKQGTYRVLDKKYGQIGSAETEAQKGLARGLKDQISDAVPEVGELNARESKILATLGITERRALMDLNKNPIGLAALAHNPLTWAAFMADKSALFKSLVARMINPSKSGAAGDLLSIGTPAAQYPLLEQYAPQLLPFAVNSQNALSQPR